MSEHYTRLPSIESGEVEDESKHSPLSTSATDLEDAQTTIRSRKFFTFLPFLLHFVVFLSYSLYLSSISVKSQPLLAWPNIYNGLHLNEAVQRSGEGISKFQGRPTSQTEKAWAELLDVGIVSITPEEAARLPFDTSPNVNEPDRYVVELNVFHQLHCLNMLRNQVWHPRHISWTAEDPIGWWEYHIDHCIEHLRMSLMCKADTTPQRFVLDEHQKYSLPTRQQFQCVDFDAVWAWAEGRNTTGDVPGVVAGLEEKNEMRFDTTLKGQEG